ncbi:MAG: molecular chaperone TorD family protein [Desulfocapsaceae bacterium]|nr:molecular chaperone TorD family protein [Desulfocapsaceae bacterium]
MDVNAVNKARVVYYGLLSSLFSFCLGRDQFDNILKSIDVLRKNPIDEQTGSALNRMQEKLTAGGWQALKDESDAVFYNPTAAFVPMTASFYAEQRDDGAKRREMIGYVLESKFRRNADEFKEQEDHVEFVLFFMQQLILEELRGDASCRILAGKVFANILNEMLDEFADGLVRHAESRVYTDAALVLQSFTECERLFLDIAGPVRKKQDACRPSDRAEILSGGRA